ncbi:MAG: alpha/beta fold hydrolase [Alphaproteobacteria bacterium]|nr:alpha/beta fold hydrolase [Alphaproteobacteria bacterium]
MTDLTAIDQTIELVRYLAERPVDRARTGQTPHAIIHRQNKACVRYFHPRGGAKHAPLFVSMPLINTWTVFDLMPGRSVIEKLVAAGVPVYLLDWGRPGVEDQPVTMVENIDGILMRALDRSRRHARAHLGTDVFDVLGYCVGGTFLSIAMARHDGAARRMALLAAPIDFHKSGRLSTWAQPDSFPLDDIIDGFGNFPKELMRSSFAWLRPMGQLTKYKGLAERIDDDGFRELWAAMEQWNGDNVDFPGETYREYVRRCYFDNALMRTDGDWELGGRRVDLSQGTIPVQVFAAGGDHIAAPAACRGIADVWGGPVQTMVVKGGHVGVCIGNSFPKALLAWIEQGGAPTASTGAVAEAK